MAPEQLIVMSVIIFIAACYVVYLYVISAKFNRWLGLKQGETRQVILQRLSGVIIFGIVPFTLACFSRYHNSANYGLSLPSGSTFLYALLFGLIIIPVNYITSKSPGILRDYPQIREKIWSSGLLLLSAFTWILYLLGYEFLFRGFLLFFFADILGVGASVTINLIIYSLFHIHKGWKEMLGSLPFGAVACYFTILTGNMWFAVILHCILALTNEWFALYRNPSMVVKFGRK